MRDLFGIIAFFGLLWLCFRTDIPEKSVQATERWLDQIAADLPTTAPPDAKTGNSDHG